MSAFGGKAGIDRRQS